MSTNRFTSPIENPEIVQRFGENSDLYVFAGLEGHNGIDIAATVGTTVHAAAPGLVHFAGHGSDYFLMGSAAGNCVVLHHDNGFLTTYSHLDTIHVARGEVIDRGHIVGDVGLTGYTGGPHLHFEALEYGPGLTIATANGYLGRCDPEPLTDWSNHAE